MDDFPTMFTDDPMINFATPTNLGFGIARGTACCLFSGKRILDYSGQLLNLAARLNDLARPKGLVIDGAYQKDGPPETPEARISTKTRLYTEHYNVPRKLDRGLRWKSLPW